MIDSGNDAGHRQPLNIPPPDIATIYSTVTMRGARYRDFSASRQEARDRFRQRLLLKRRVEAARKAREHVVPAETAAPGEPAGAPEATQIPAREEILESAPAPAEEAIPVPAQEPEVEQARAEEQTPPSVPSQDEDRKPEAAQAGSGARWFALRSILAGDAERRSGVRIPKRPALAIYSQAGGVGKTSLAATIGRVLAARGEQVFLAETASPGLLPLFYGSREIKPGVVRTFSPPAGSENAAVQAVTLEPVTLEPRQFLETKDAPDPLGESLLRYARGSNRILIDIRTGSQDIAHRLLPLVSMVLVPLLADMNSVVSLDAVEAVFADRGVEPVYLLNQFDGSLPLHAEVRGLLREQLGSRLLPFVIRGGTAVSEALAEGMTVVDWAPGSPVTEDYIRVADWLVSVAPAPASDLRALRWSERQIQIP